PRLDVPPGEAGLPQEEGLLLLLARAGGLRPERPGGGRRLLHRAPALHPHGRLRSGEASREAPGGALGHRSHPRHPPVGADLHQRGPGLCHRTGDHDPNLGPGRRADDRPRPHDLLPHQSGRNRGYRILLALARALRMGPRLPALHRAARAGPRGRAAVEVSVSRSVRLALLGLSLLALARPAGSAPFLTFEQITRGLDGLNGPRGLALSPDGAHLYVASTNDDALAVFRCDTPTRPLPFVHPPQNGVGGLGVLDEAPALVLSPAGLSVF